MTEQEPRVPPDPSGIEEPHDVLAAEEFPMPAADQPEEPSRSRHSAAPPALLGLLLLAVVALVVLRRRL